MRNTNAALAAAHQHFIAGRLKQAETLLRSVLAVAPHNAEALEAMAYVTAKQGEPGHAADYILQALKRLSPEPRQYYVAACICQAARRHDDAVALFARCLERLPEHVPSRMGMALSTAELGDQERALSMLERLTATHSQFAELHYNKGRLLGTMGRYDDEIAAYRSAIAIDPNYTLAHINLGVVLRDLHRFDEALAQFGRAIEIDPNHAGARTNRAQTNLLLGNFEPGWREYEWRWLDGGPTHGFDQARLWTGEQSIAGKTVLAHFEQGIGDTLQFVRYVDQLVEAGARVVLRTQDALLPLLHDYRGVTQIIGEQDAVPRFDFHCPLLSLPLAFRTGPANIPAPVPYLRADPPKSDKWRDATRRTPGRPLVGIAWAGSRHHVDDRNRSIPLAALAPLFNMQADFVSLQRDVKDEDLELMGTIGSLSDMSQELETYADTAALISQLDLVISVDTSVAHLAGALGKPLWLALPFTPDWRWQMHRPDSPWYPQARLFRQSARGDWTDVLNAIASALDTWTPARLD